MKKRKRKANFDVLRSLSQEAPKVKKNGSKVNEIKVPKELAKVVDAYTMVRQKYDEVRAKLNLYGSQIREWAEKNPDIVEKIANGQKSFRISGTKSSVLVIFQDRFSPITLDEAETVRRIVGEKKFDEITEPVVEFRLRPEVATNPDKVEELKKILGDRLNEFFEVEVKFKPKSGFLMMIYQKFKSKAKELRGLFKHTTPSIRVVK